MAELVIPPEFIDLEHPTVLRALLRHIIEHADCDGVDAFGRPVLRFEFACEAWLLDKLPCSPDVPSHAASRSLVVGDDPEGLVRVAETIRQAIADGNMPAARPADLDYGITEALKGAFVTHLHLHRERNRKHVEARKARALKRYSCICCEACGFSFE